MVVNTAKHTKGRGKNTHLPMEKSDAEYSGYRDRPRRKCGIVTSLVFNLMMFGMLIGAGVYLCRYRREICRLKIDHGITIAQMIGVEYEVDNCKVQLIYKDGLFSAEPLQSENNENDVSTEEGKLEIAPEILENIDDERMHRRGRRRKHHRRPRPKHDNVPIPKTPE
ncbi:uncharacterized protein LOC120347589 [Styela clava]